MPESAAKLASPYQTMPSHWWKNYLPQLFAGVCIGGFATLSFTTIFSFINPVLATTGKLSNSQFMLLQFCGVLVAVITLIVTAFFADKYTPRSLMQGACGATLVVAGPLCYFFANVDSIWGLFCGEALLIIISEIFLGPANALLKRIFPSEIRYRGVAVSFTLGMSIVGGITPLLENWIYHYQHTFTGIAAWVSFFSLTTYLALAQLPKVKLHH